MRGGGHIASVIKDEFNPTEFTFIDIVDRGYPGTIVEDFLNWNENFNHYDTIITNPPYTYVSEFVYKCMKHLVFQGQLAMFLRIQFLETQNRQKLFSEYPPKYIYVFSKRMPVFAGGIEKDPKTGKPWATTLCNAWFVWQKGFCGEPVVRWL